MCLKVLNECFENNFPHILLIYHLSHLIYGYVVNVLYVINSRNYVQTKCMYAVNGGFSLHRVTTVLKLTFKISVFELAKVIF